MGVISLPIRRIGHPAATVAQAPAAKPRSFAATKISGFAAAAYPCADAVADAEVC